MIIALKENKSKTKVRTDIFLFRDPKNVEKFKQAQKMSWKEDEDEKNQLYGEALEYPDFAILDFSELLKERKKYRREILKLKYLITELKNGKTFRKMKLRKF